MHQSGTLVFPPLTPSVTIENALLPGKSQAAVAFELELSDASAGYTDTVPVQVRIWPDVQIRSDSLTRRNDGKWQVQIDGTLPMRYYAIQASKDMRTRRLAQVFQSFGTSAQADLPHPGAEALSEKAEFLRIIVLSVLSDGFWP